MTSLFASLIADLKSDKKSLWILVIGVSLILLLSAGMLVIVWFSLSQPSPSQANAGDPGILFTQAMETALEELTQQVILQTVTITETPTQIPILTSTSSQTVIMNEEEATASWTPSLIASSTPSPVLPTPTVKVPSLIPTTIVCNSAQFIRDVTVMDDTAFAPDTTFVKTWRIKNTGSCSWSQDYNLEFVAGNVMGAKQSIPLPSKVGPGQTLDISVSMKSPTNKGNYRGDWMLSSPNGVRFGMGSSGTGTLYVSIKVVNLTNPTLVFDFAANYCKAKWQSGAGVLPCPGTNSGTEGFVTLLDEPKLESRQEDELALWTHPQPIQKGWISGTYASFTIQPGHHFSSWIGCLGDSKGCNVTFRLDILNTKNGQLINLGGWQEVYDGKITIVDIDLSQHAGKTVQFIMTIEVSGGDPTQSNAFWFVPGIVQRTTPSVTPSHTPTPTYTPSPTHTWTLTPSPTATATSTATQTHSQHEIVLMALNTFANNLGIESSALDIILVREVEWLDSCLGLPKEDEICTPVVTPGFRIIVTYDRTIYEIRTNQDGGNIRWEMIKFLID